MFKRILEVALVLILFPLLFPAIFLIPPIAIYVAIKYIITGEENLDLVFSPMTWVIDLPHNIIDKI